MIMKKQQQERSRTLPVLEKCRDHHSFRLDRRRKSSEF